MQVLSVAGVTTDRATWQNVVNVPAHGSSVVRIPFETNAGRSVCHCHILDHEDNGMMGVIEVRLTSGACADRWVSYARCSHFFE